MKFFNLSAIISCIRVTLWFDLEESFLPNIELFINQDLKTRSWNPPKTSSPKPWKKNLPTLKLTLPLRTMPHNTPPIISTLALVLPSTLQQEKEEDLGKRTNLLRKWLSKLILIWDSWCWILDSVRKSWMNCIMCQEWGLWISITSPFSIFTTSIITRYLVLLLIFGLFFLDINFDKLSNKFSNKFWC